MNHTGVHGIAYIQIQLTPELGGDVVFIDRSDMIDDHFDYYVIEYENGSDG